MRYEEEGDARKQATSHILILGTDPNQLESAKTSLGAAFNVEFYELPKWNGVVLSPCSLGVLVGKEALGHLFRLESIFQDSFPLILYNCEVDKADRVKVRKAGVISIIESLEDEAEFLAAVNNILHMVSSGWAGAEKSVFEQELTAFLRSLFTQYSGFKTQDLCEKMQLSHSTLYRKTKDAFGESPNRLILIFKMEHAVDLLQKNEWSIKQIAYTCGFSSATYFTRAFKQIYGFTPGQYRRDKMHNARIVRLFE